MRVPVLSFAGVGKTRSSSPVAMSRTFKLVSDMDKALNRLSGLIAILVSVSSMETSSISPELIAETASGGSTRGLCRLGDCWPMSQSRSSFLEQEISLD